MNKKTIYSILTALCIIGFWLFDNFYTPDTYSDPEKKEAVTSIATNFIPSSTTGAVVKHNNYMLSYNEKHEQAEWVAYQLDKSQLTYDDRKRPYFIEDPKVKTKSADYRNYKGSGYDRGHLCPAGDRRFSKYAYDETFYTSNISPQNNAFNAGIWNELEKQVRYWAKKYGTVYVITAGVLENNLASIGDEDVSVPNYFYKIVARDDGDAVKMIGFLFKNEASNTSIKSHLVSIDEIERKTGIDFFENLPDALENKLESKVVSDGWKF
ncbi:DNA/RNA non-specific endonuclease [Cellulophaga baltica]|uniref:DNA/RNA non-specific endonuclease n=1 Tax=Cellulophaga TaxID=104264 RepID=UPI001C076011|nr:MULTISPECIES: DNA/RNA non-specific endonuclease [Cellulophaga]MBU2995459.1 DNA/RNA non-specific endonuclease [Cellulophaga baltica]MDO6766853.1 DNA/RNA non-specific endonuclease [Cellulophaga sp. 1_MG-2023]